MVGRDFAVVVGFETPTTTRFATPGSRFGPRKGAAESVRSLCATPASDLARFVESQRGVAGTEASQVGAPTPSYERSSGAACQSLGPGYRRREPEKKLLHATVREHLATFLEETRERSATGAGFPRFVEQEFERYLKCGILAHGFARVRCGDCGNDLLVALSCKGRGLCPSCNARRTHDTAAHLVDSVLPHAPVRQWVLSLPRRARWLLARDPQLLSRALDIALRAIFRSYRKRARRLGLRDAKCGAITFVQRFGGALNLNVHYHCALVDGVLVKEGDSVRFVSVGKLTDDEVEAVLARIVRRLAPLLRPRDDDGAEEPPGPLAAAQMEALLPASHATLHEPPRRKQQSALLEGYSLHAGVHLHANDREGIERLLCYGARGPLSLDRLGALPDGRLTYKLRHPLAGGRSMLVLTPTEFLWKLAVLVPPPRHHLVRFHGVFGPNAALRSLVVPRPAEPVPQTSPSIPGPRSSAPAAVPLATNAQPAPDQTGRARIPWAYRHTVSILGAPAETLAELSRSDEVTMTVVGHRGRNMASRILLGSVADRLVQISPKPVLVTH